MVGNMLNGEQQALGPGCFARMGLEFAKSLLDPIELAERLGPLFVQGGNDAPAGKSGGKKRRSEPEPAAEPAAATGTDGGPDEVPAPAEDR